MKIGILTRKIESKLNVTINGCPITYLNIFNKDDFIVLIDSTINLDKNKEQFLKQIEDIDGFILPGGENISEVDLFIIDYCYNNNIPLLGICLGMQEIATYFNSNTLKKIKDESHFDLEKDYVHDIQLNKKGYLYNLLNKDIISVNSRHHYKISKNKNYIIEAKIDNIIEAIKVKGTDYMLGLQFHPEIMQQYDENAKTILYDFKNKCKKFNTTSVFDKQQSLN